jgi:deoxyribodipyrimidine photolyase-related protein
MGDCTLIFPFQLFDPHPAIIRSRPVILVEEGLIFGDPHVDLRFHQQKLVLHRASMKTYAARLQQRGLDVRYRDFMPGKTIADHLAALQAEGFDTFHYCDPVDFLLEKRLQRAADARFLSLQMQDTPMFLSPPEFLEKELGNKKRLLMGRFYQQQRQRLGILVNPDGTPHGGQWSFDEANRKSMPKRGLEVPPDPRAGLTPETRAAIAHVPRHFPDGPGEATGFHYPVSHDAALRWLDDFLEQRLGLFGDYEDAISQHERVLFHGVLTPMLNIGLLTPHQVVNRTLEFAKARKVPLNCLEGFIRQIIGWREFMRGTYQYLGVRCRNGNFFGFEDRPVPTAFYEGTTGIEPVDTVIRRVLDHGYCHHIERLMVLGNFMLLCGLHPRRVYDWFMELFVDAYDWVMVPNVFGMSQFADGGLFTTKPYLSGSNYIRKMSDFPKGDWCAIWDGLFWNFIQTHATFFRSQHRLGMMVRQLDRMDVAKRDAHRRRAEDFLGSLY